MAGITETKQALKALIKIGVVARQVGADGWQLSDAGLVIRNDELQTAIADGLEGADRIVDELSDLSFQETIELVSTLAEAAQMFERAP